MFGERPKSDPGARKTRKSGTQMVDFCKRPQMKILLAPARSSRRDGKVSYITLLQMSSLTRRKSLSKFEEYQTYVGPTCHVAMPRQRYSAQNSAPRQRP